MSQPQNQSALTYSDILLAVRQGIEPIQKQVDSIVSIVERLRDESRKQISRDDFDRLTQTFVSRDFADQRYHELKQFIADLEKKVGGLETKESNTQQRSWQSWQTIAMLIAGWLFMIVLNVLTRVVH
jgi:hypothetical protein